MSNEVKHPNFVDENGNIYLVRCPKCDKENYAPAVATGICVWCGYDANEKQEGKDFSENSITNIDNQ